MEENESMNEQQDPKQTVFSGVTIGVPTFGKVSTMWTISQLSLAIPIFTNIGYHFLQGKPVDIARSEIALNALNTGQGFVFFRDDDTLVPRDGLSKLMKRLPIEDRTHPKDKANMVVGGVVYTKTEPPVPMIHIEGISAGFEDWEYGELVECDIIGMGCTLIPTAVFKKTLPFIRRWTCANETCQVKWHNEYDCDGNLIVDEHDKVVTNVGDWDKDLPESKEKIPVLFCPACKFPLVPMWFKTIRLYDDEGKPSTMTEDSYFLLMAKKAGVKVYVDCGVICEHEEFNPDPQKSRYFTYSPELKMPVWRQGNLMYFWPSADNDQVGTVHKKEAVLAERNGHKPGKAVKFNLGSGGVNKKGYINMDLSTECDFQADARNLSAAVQKYGKPTEIYASHLLEHIPRAQMLPTFRHWLKCLRPGGVLLVETPDALWAAEKFLNDARNGGDGWGEAVLFGAQRWPGDEHLTPLYEDKFKQMIRACRGLIAKSTVRTVFPKTSNQQVVKVRVVKK